MQTLEDGTNMMTKSLRAVAVVMIAGTLVVPANVSAQVAPAAGAPAVRPGAKSLRPADLKRIRTSVLRMFGWSVGIPGNVFRQLTFSEAAAMADALGLGSIEGFSTQSVSPVISKNLNYELTPDEVTAVKSRLNELRLKMPAYHVESMGPDEATHRKVFSLAKGLGVETIIAPLEAQSLPAIDKMANEFGINVAVESTGNPNPVMSALQGRSQRVGVSADIGLWIEGGIRPTEGLALLKDRLMVARLRDRDRFGSTGIDVPLGNGVAGLPQFLMEVARQQPVIQEFPGKCTNCYVGFTGIKPLFIALDAKYYDVFDQLGLNGGAGEMLDQLRLSAEGFEKSARLAMGYRVEQDSHLHPSTNPALVPADERQKIEAALPRQGLARPKKPRKLLVLDLCPMGDFHHLSIAHTNLAVQLMAKNTGAFEPVFSNDLNNLKYPSITQFDAVLLNSTVGETFIDPSVLNGLLRFVREGGGVAGIHAATYGSQNLPEFAEMMGAADGPHRVEPATIRIEDLNSPLTKGFAGKESFAYTDEYYHFLPTGPYSREKLHVLISIDAGKSDMSRWKVRPDNDYGLVWIKNYGKGRVFNSAMGHMPSFFATPELAQLVLGGIQFVLGDLDADATPSGDLATIKK
jgi:type 1 glutamine amidotransferase